MSGEEPAKPNHMENHKFSVVVIGCSAGGLDAMEALFRSLPPKTGMGFVVIQHSTPEPGSRLPEILSHFTKMPVQVAEDGGRIEPDKIYVLPSNKLGSLKADGSFLLRERPSGSSRRMPIDSLIESAAEAFKERTIAVILSGMDADGTAGARAVKAAGGLTFAQSEESATHFTMPLAAIHTGVVDFVLSAEEIGVRLGEIALHPLIVMHPTSEPEEQGLWEILRILRERSGIDFPLYKQSTVKRRIARRMVIHKIETYRQYAQLLSAHPEEIDSLREDMLIKVTGFFRDPHVFEALKLKVYPAMGREKGNDSPIRVWVPGCATGEEVYSLAISLIEHLGEHSSQTPLQVFGTDISEKALAKARMGLYAPGEVGGLTPGRLRRFFVEADGGFRIKKLVRDCCVFARQDFTSDPPFTRMDLISCRNVLIYLGRALQSRVLPLFHYALSPGGFLLLGPSESVGEFASMFVEVDKKNRIFGKKQTVEPLSLTFRPSSYQLSEQAWPIQHRPFRSVPPDDRDIQHEADRILLGRYAPAAVVVNESMDILVFRGDTSPYFAPRAGKASLNLLSLIQDTLRMEIHNLLHKARKSGKPERAEEASFMRDGGMEALALEVMPFSPSETEERSYLIIFEDTRLYPRAAGKNVAPPKGIPESEKDRIIARLKADLASTHEYMQTMVEEQERFNQEMQAANEEILSSNEELQSLNEELQTAKEELESSNEELATVNQELQDRNEELFRINNDLQNLIASVEIPIVIMDEELRIRRFSPSAEKILSIIPTDKGRLITDINTKLELPDLEALLAQVIDSVTNIEREVRDKDGRWYSLRIRPYMTETKKIDGAVLSLVDIDQLKRATQLIEDERNFAQGIVETAADPLLTLDAQFVVVTANPAFHEAFGLADDQVVGKPVRDLPHEAWRSSDLRDILLTRLPAGEAVDQTPFVLDIPGKGLRHFTLTARKMVSQVKSGAYLLAFRDITERVNVEEILRAAMLQAETASRYKSLFLANMSHEIRTPLNAVLGLLDLMLAEDLPEEQRKRAVIMRESAHSLLEIIDDILDYSKIEAGKLEFHDEDFSLRKLLDCVMNEQRLQGSRKDLKVILRVDENVPDALRAPRLRLRQVLTNLLSNAVKFTDSGTITVEVVDATGREPAEVKRGEHDMALEFRVTDTGPGIDAENVERIFESFTQGDQGLSKRFKGTGLGLAISRMIITRMGGHIWVRSAIGEGSTFGFTLPLDHARGDVSADPEDLDSEPTVLLPPLRVLVAEDNTINQMVIDQMLTALGHPHTIAATAQEALDRLSKEPFDIVLMDIQMPGMDGIEATRRIRDASGGALDPRVPVIGLSAYTMKEDVERFLAAGLDGYVIKPASLAALNSEFRRVLSARGRLEPGAALPKACDPSDVCSMLERFNERTGLRDKLIALYRQQAPEHLDKLILAMDGGDAAAAEAATHSLISIASTIGDTQTMLLSREIAKTAQEGRLDAHGGLVAKLRGALYQFLADLDRLVPKEKKPD